MKMDGGVDAVRVVPIRMKDGGDAAEKLLAEGPPEGPTQFKMPDERMLTKRRELNIQPRPVPAGDKPPAIRPAVDVPVPTTCSRPVPILGPDDHAAGIFILAFNFNSVELYQT